MTANGAYRPIEGVTPQPRPGSKLEDEPELEAFIDQLVHQLVIGAKAAAGATISIVKDGRLLLCKGYGVADSATGRVADGDTLFRIGSTSKLFTATAAMQLVEQGKLDLHADINTYLGAGLQIPDAFGQKITLKHLLTHTAGFEENQLGTVIKPSAATLVPLEHNLREYMPKRVRPPVTDFSHGYDAGYSNWGLALAGHIVERAAGVPFDDYVEQHIFMPLGMTRSTFREPLPEGWEAKLSKGHALDGKGGFLPQDFEFFHSSAPAGGMTSTARDMACFMMAHLRGSSTRLMREDTLSLMHSRVLSQHPSVNGSGLGFYEVHLNGRRMISHRGKTIFFPSKLVLFPDDNIGLFVAFNAPQPMPAAHALPTRLLLEAFMAKYLPAEHPVAVPRPQRGTARQYEGGYLSTVRSHTKIEKFLPLAFDEVAEIEVKATSDHTLTITNLIGRPATAFEWHEVDDGVFWHRESQEVIAFVEDDSGKRRRLVGVMAFAAAEKMAWHQRPAFHQSVLEAGTLAFLLALFGGIAHALIGAGGTASPGYPLWLAAVAGALDIHALRAMHSAMMNPYSLLFGYPKSFKRALTQVLISIPLIAAVTGFGIAAWYLGWWNLAGRIAYTAIVLGNLGTLWSLNHWNLVGYKFP